MTDHQKTPTAQYLSQFAQKIVARFIAQLGMSLPCHVTKVEGSIVTVSFDVTSQYTLPQVTIPMFGPEYIRYPTQVGDRGVVFPVDAGIGPTSGLGTGIPVLSQKQGNLSNLVFFPVGSKIWTATDDPNAVVIYGPDGVILETVAKDSVITVGTGVTTIKSPSIVLDGAVTLTNGSVVVIGGTLDLGSANLTTTGTVVAAGKSLSTHTHGGVTTGAGTTGPPT